MTTQIFQAWLHHVDRRFVAKVWKVLFVLENFSTHTKVSGLKNIEHNAFPAADGPGNYTVCEKPL